MTIRIKSNILVTIFTIVLLFNTVGLFVSLSKIQNANNHLIEETKLTSLLEKLKFITKNIQELGTDLSLMGEKEGLLEIDTLIQEYKTVRKAIKDKNTHEENNVLLKSIDSIFDNYIFSLKNMVNYGIKSVENRNELIQILVGTNQNLTDEQKDIFNRFMNSTLNVEDSMEKVNTFSKTKEKNINKKIIKKITFLKK